MPNNMVEPVVGLAPNPTSPRFHYRNDFNLMQ